MKKNIAIGSFCVVNICILYCFGVSTFFTTVSLYLVFFYPIKFLLDFLEKKIPSKLLLNNVRVLFVLCLVLEALLLFVLRFVNTYDENKHYLYLSPYKQREQLQLRSRLGKKDVTYKYTEGYLPNSSAVLTTKEFSDTFKYNESGFRGNFLPIKKDSNEYRIIVLGDSFVEGIGTENDSTIASLLQKKLQVDNSNVIVMNAGISGSYPKHETTLFYSKLQQYKPDLVVMVCCFNDPSDAFFFENEGKIPLHECLFASSRIYRMIYAHFVGFEPGYVRKKSIQDKYSKHANDLTKHIQAFQHKLEQKNIDFICTYIPIAAEIGSSSTGHNFVNKSFHAELTKNGLDVLHLQEQNIDSIQIHEWYWKKDAHLKPKGYDMVATLLAAKIKTKNYVGTF